ncbi:rod shape-determining MreC family protein [Chlamydia ibidis]|uniref:Cell shape-determining protein MreC n=2 Tax=Chlamydia ibidis TaxID=1405396 RepID=S7KE45_9CHLA|nr:rod shape-determining MreC family protein [Chlamydia ibidis]
MQRQFVRLHSLVFLGKPQNHCDYTYESLENLFLKERVTLLEERLSYYQDSQCSLPLFPNILSSYFRDSKPCRIIYRDPAYWGSSCWVNVGKQQGVQKNSPVLSGKFLVGLVDYVGNTQSRIRLITDVGMKPSVVAVRGGIQAWVVKNYARELINHIEKLSDVYILEKDKYEKIFQLEELESLIPCNEENTWLLRGTLSGRGGSLWQPEASILYGEGFFSSNGKTTLQIGDILVTTGLDGVFPPGLLVAKVLQIFPPNEGACCFKIEAQSLATDITQSHLLILPPMEFNPNDRPDVFGLLWE